MPMGTHASYYVVTPTALRSFRTGPGPAHLEDPASASVAAVYLGRGYWGLWEALDPISVREAGEYGDQAKETFPVVRSPLGRAVVGSRVLSPEFSSEWEDTYGVRGHHRVTLPDEVGETLRALRAVPPGVLTSYRPAHGPLEHDLRSLHRVLTAVYDIADARGCAVVVFIG